MRDKIQQIREKALAEIDKADGLEKLNDVRAAILGKKGELTAVLKGMKDVAPDERPKVGQWVNETREAVEKLLDEKVKKFEAEALKRKYESEKIDVTMPAKRSKKGNLHPVTQVKDQLSEIFTSMGFEVYEGTEIENDYYNFTALSEGEQQLISVLGLMAILRDDNEEVLYLIDEPDTHINPQWQRNFIKLLLDNIGDGQHRHMFISTHSPFLVQAYEDNVVDILLFRKDNDNGKIIIDIANSTIKNWRIDQVLMSPYFGLESTRPSSIDDFMNKRLAIIRQGELSEDDKAELLNFENELGFLPTGETLTELESMVFIHKAAKRFKEESKK